MDAELGPELTDKELLAIDAQPSINRRVAELEGDDPQNPLDKELGPWAAPLGLRGAVATVATRKALTWALENMLQGECYCDAIFSAKLKRLGIAPWPQEPEAEEEPDGTA